MKKDRLESFSDGLFSVVITIMVLELNAPIQTALESLKPLMPIFLSYLLSFIYGTIFWINHHHLLAATRVINSTVIWANMNFLFWLSLMPFFTSWVDENHAAAMPVAAYGVSLLTIVVSYRILELILFKLHDADAPIVKILKPGKREKVSIILFLIAIPIAFANSYAALIIYIIIACIWFMPQKALEKALMNRDS